VDASKVWPILAASSSTATAILVGVVVYLTWHHGREGHALQVEMAASLESVRRQVEANAASTWLDSKSVINNCYADNSNVTCTVTNVRRDPITTCLRGKLTQKKEGGVSMHSLVICTGRLEPRQTRTTAAPWMGGFARDLCYSTDRWGNDVLDWQACSFTTESVDLRTLESEGI